MVVIMCVGSSSYFSSWLFQKIWMESSKTFGGFLKIYFKKKTYGNTLALFISSWSSFVAANIQKFAIKFCRNLDELYQNWLYAPDALLMHCWCTFDALLNLMHFWCTFNTFWCTLMHFWKVLQKCIKSASKMHRNVIRTLFGKYITIFDQTLKKERACSQFQVEFTGCNLR